jgi:hypothetical protein
MKKYFTVVLLINFIGILTPTYGQWQKYIIDDNISTAVTVDVADMAGDTKLDLVVTNYYGKELILYQNNFPNWIEHTIDDVYATVAYSGDMDGDSTLDVVACLYSAGKMVWYENNHPTWTQHIIDENTDNADYFCIADIDGDDTLDVVTAGGLNGGDVVWYENNHPNWLEHTIESGSGIYASLKVIDIDGDGLLDVAATMPRENKVVWFRNENNGLTWTKDTIDDSLISAFGLNIGDIDGDGKMDLVATTGGPYYNGSDVVWYKNDHPIWTKHIIDTNLLGCVDPRIADVDGDYTMDVIAAGFFADDVVWYKNNLPDTNWTKDTIDANLDGPRVFAVSDLDGDEMIDVIVPGTSKVVWYKNPYTTVAYGKSFEVYPKYISPQQGDTLKLIAQIINSENHQVTVHALIQANNSTFQDSLQLFDDGLHNDSLPSDNIFGGLKWLDELDEDYFDIKLRTTDSDESITTYCANVGHFSTIGPVVFDNYETPQWVDTLFTLQYSLRNDDSTNTVTAVTAVVSTTDTNVAINQGTSHFGDIAPGEVKSQVSFPIAIYHQNSPSSIDFIVHIFSDGSFFWSDNFTVIVPVTGIAENETNLPIEYALKQNYPNPFNPVTTIKYQIPELSFVTLKVYDVLGSEIITLVNEEKPVGSYEVEFNAAGLPSGVYFYQLNAGEFINTKKMILLK